VSREDIQTLDHPKGVERGQGRLGPDIGHAEHVPAAQLLFHIGNDVQELGIESNRSLKQA